VVDPDAGGQHSGVSTKDKYCSIQVVDPDSGGQHSAVSKKDNEHSSGGRF
jgi:hypothetical protein